MHQLCSKDPLTQFAQSLGITSWNQLADYIQQLPYGRNTSRADLQLVLAEQKGTCSSKHALLKKMADLNGIPNVVLLMAIYRMNSMNTPKAAPVLLEYGLDFIPEAHCYLKINETRKDFTTPQSDFKTIENDIIKELEITPEQTITFKVAHHQNFINNWLKENNYPFKFSKLWEIREKCIASLAAANTNL